MKRFLLILITTLSLSIASNAAHIKGGFFTYRYIGPGTAPNTSQYQITLTVYMICSATGGQINDPINFSFFNAGDNTFIQNVSVSITNDYFLNKLWDPPCITGDQTGCYYRIIVYNLASVELANLPEGYVVSYQRCCRIAGINNVVNSGAVGNTFTIKIPGTASGYHTNSSPMFLVNDTAVVCRNSYFEYSFQASDPDGTDSLTYNFCSAYIGADQNNSATPTATAPPYNIIPYAAPFSGAQPMGGGVTINRNTGLISGNAPDIPGQYVVCVCVNEYRGGQLIGTVRKELHITVGDCNPLDAQLNPRNATCDGFTVCFQNDATGNPPGTEYLWVFGDALAGSGDTSRFATDCHTYTDTGVYTVKLKVALPGGICADSSTQIVRVFPGFSPGFVWTGNCFTNPFQFTDTTYTAYGVVDSWSWNFGDNSTLADTSHIRNPQWTYPGAGIVNVTLIVTNSKGCIDTTAPIAVDILDKPPLSVNFADTLICRTDQVQLHAVGTGAFSWTPPVAIVNANTPDPTVSPPTDQWYYVNLNANGCFNRDSVHVRVVAAVSLAAMADTTICEGDQLQLNAVTNGLQYTWSPGGNMNDSTLLNPIVTVSSPTQFTIISQIGSCRAQDQVFVDTKPYPGADAGIAPTLCYNTSGQLNASIVGSSFTWTPPSYMNDPTILNPIVTPPRTTRYILTVYDTLGCPKPTRDTVIVTVIPKLHAYAGRDTTVVINQPLQFQGSGGTNYVWSPAFGLNDPNVPDPIGVYGAGTDSIQYTLVVTDTNGCMDSDSVIVYVFQTVPYVFVPTAFTPNNDGLNDSVKPICVGIRKLIYFQIFNRWGERVFYTTHDKSGWDGNINGRKQSSAVYVWMVSAEDYLGRPLFLKGTVTLIR